MKWSPDAVAAHCRLHFHHFLQPSSVLVASQHLDQQCSGTTNIAAEGPEMPCYDGRPSLLADVNGDVTSAGSGTVVVEDGCQDSNYPTDCMSV